MGAVESVEAVRAYYEALNAGDYDTCDDFMAEDAVADASRRQVEPGVWYGKEAVNAAARKVREAWERLTVEPEELLPIGDNVVVAVVMNRARGAHSGAEVESRTAQVWTVEDGKATRFEYFGTKEEALAAYAATGSS
jgi:hypothetical protein